MSGESPSGASAEISQNPEERTGFPPEMSPHGEVLGPRPAWIPDALLAETVEVWSEAYGRPVGEEEAVEILVNVKRLGEAILKAKRQMRR